MVRTRFLEIKPAFISLPLIQRRNQSVQTGLNGIRPPPSLRNPPAAGGKLDVADVLLLVRLPFAELISPADYLKKSARRGQHINRSAAGVLAIISVSGSS